VTDRVPLRRQPGGAYLYDLAGLTPYRDALRLMTDLAAARSQGAVPDTVVVCEHDPVVTLGASTDEAADGIDRAALAARGIEVVEIDRGGRATYHGPGQLVVYPVLDLADYGRDLRGYVGRLEEALVAALATLGVAAEVREGREFVGVWTPAGRKIASIGVHVSRWITTHGLALNVSCDLAPFSLFSPCGLQGVEVTSIEVEAGREVSRAEAAAAVLDSLGEALGLSYEAVPVA
jgi:lipoate-protein ligase B